MGPPSRTTAGRALRALCRRPQRRGTGAPAARARASRSLAALAGWRQRASLCSLPRYDSNPRRRTAFVRPTPSLATRLPRCPGARETARFASLAPPTRQQPTPSAGFRSPYALARWPPWREGDSTLRFARSPDTTATHAVGRLSFALRPRSQRASLAALARWRQRASLRSLPRHDSDACRRRAFVSRYALARNAPPSPPCRVEDARLAAATGARRSGR